MKPLPAGRFSTWLRATRKAIREDSGMEVPCGDCDACCRSGYFVHIRADETATLNRIPKKLLFAAPLHPRGDKVLGYDEHGHCPMLGKHGCTIYDARPATCRRFDCRVLAATGLAKNGLVDNDIFERARRWRFSYPTQRDRKLHAAVRAAAKFLMEHPEFVQDRLAKGDPIRISVEAIKMYEAFM